MLGLRFMMHSCGLVVSLLILPGVARRSTRIRDSHQYAQQQQTELANGLEVSAEAQEALIPGGVGTGMTRRSALSSAAGAAGAALLPRRAFADVRGANEFRPTDENGVNKLLTSRGFPPLKVPSGMSPLAGFIGVEAPANIDGQKVKARAFQSPLLVRFLFPNGWLVETPTITDNGEAGNLAANNFQKGDSASFAALELPKGKQLSTLDKDFFKQFVSSQMTSDVFEDVKVKKIRPVTQSDGTEMVLVDFTYTLVTRAGFSVNRQGVAGATVVDNAVMGVIAATTATSYNKLSEKLVMTADSFRAYPVKASQVVQT